MLAVFPFAGRAAAQSVPPAPDPEELCAALEGQPGYEECLATTGDAIDSVTVPTTPGASDGVDTSGDEEAPTGAEAVRAEPGGPAAGALRHRRRGAGRDVRRRHPQLAAIDEATTSGVLPRGPRTDELAHPSRGPRRQPRRDGGRWPHREGAKAPARPAQPHHGAAVRARGRVRRAAGVDPLERDLGSRSGRSPGTSRSSLPSRRSGGPAAGSARRSKPARTAGPSSASRSSPDRT